MSVGHARQRSNSAKGSSIRSDVKFQIPTPSITPQNDEFAFQPCAATGSFLLYAQQSTIYCLHHDTLAIERRFERHREDVLWISTDNVSERGAGRLVLSYDTGSTAIVWDLLTGDEVARFASYEQIRVASWMRNGNVAFGKYQCAGSRLRKLELMMQQATRKATSYFSNPRHLNTSQREPSSTQLLQLRQPQTVVHSQLATTMARSSSQPYSRHLLSSTHSPPRESRLLLRGYLGMGPPPSKSLRCWPLKHQMVTSECGVSRRAHMVVMRHASFVCSTSPSKENPVLAGSRGRKMDG
jgi:hypothetical protein